MAFLRHIKEWWWNGKGTCRDAGTQTEGSTECCICLADDPTVRTRCGHSFCLQCLLQWTLEKREAACPLCRRDLLDGHESDSIRSHEHNIMISITPELSRLLQEPAQLLMSRVLSRIDRYITESLLQSRREDEGVHILNKETALLLGVPAGREMSRFHIRLGLMEHVRLVT